jgi:SIR2-like domain
MARSTISHDHWRLLIERIHRGRCVPILGAGANVSSNGYQGLPLGPELTMRLAEELTRRPITDVRQLAEVTARSPLLKRHVDLARLGVEDLARVALHVMRSYDYTHLMDRLRALLPDESRQPSPLLRLLARLPVRLIVTTNYDRLMERALDEVGRQYRIVVQPIGGFEERDQTRLRRELADWGDRLVLYKIHGTFLDIEESGEAVRRVIITEEDYIEFLTVVSLVDRGVPKKIQMELATSTLLFLGYSLEDWDFRTIFKGLVEKLERHQQLKSFAIQWRPAKFWVDLWEDKGVVVYDHDVHRFAQALEVRYAAYVKRLERREGARRR